MNDADNTQLRLDSIERKLDELLSRSVSDSAKTKSRRRGLRERIFWGVFILVLGLIWLGQNFGIEWLNNLRFWPVAVIVFGLYLIFGGRDR